MININKAWSVQVNLRLFPFHFGPFRGMLLATSALAVVNIPASCSSMNAQGWSLICDKAKDGTYRRYTQEDTHYNCNDSSTLLVVRGRLGITESRSGGGITGAQLVVGGLEELGGHDVRMEDSSRDG